MLPLESEKWQLLDGPLATIKVHHLIRDFLFALDSDHSEQEISKRAREFEIEVFEEVSCQQTTYSSTTAAFPYLIEIASRLPLSARCSMWCMCGILHSDGAGNNGDDDLSSWYQTAIERAQREAVKCVLENRLDVGDQFSLFCAIANLFDELYVYYAFRSDEYIEFQCARCEAEFAGQLTDNGIEFAETTADTYSFRGVAEDDLETALSRKTSSPFRQTYDLAKRGSHQSIISWLAKRLSQFECPKCQQLSFPVEYGFKG